MAGRFRRVVCAGLPCAHMAQSLGRPAGTPGGPLWHRQQVCSRVADACPSMLSMGSNRLLIYQSALLVCTMAEYPPVRHRVACALCVRHSHW